MTQLSFFLFQAENKVTVNSINVDVSNEDILESWDASISNNLISITPKIKKDCPSILKVYFDLN